MLLLYKKDLKNLFLVSRNNSLNQLTVTANLTEVKSELVLI